jgi:hypothetical protein
LIREGGGGCTHCRKSNSGAFARTRRTPEQQDDEEHGAERDRSQCDRRGGEGEHIRRVAACHGGTTRERAGDRCRDGEHGKEEGDAVRRVGECCQHADGCQRNRQQRPRDDELS